MPDRSGFFTREVRLFLAGTLGVAAMAASLTALVMLLSGRPAGPAESGDTAAGRETGEELFGEYSLPKNYPLQRDLMLPGEDPAWMQRDLRPYRARKERWSTEDVMEYWIDPREIGIELLEERNRATLERMFREVP